MNRFIPQAALRVGAMLATACCLSLGVCHAQGFPRASLVGYEPVGWHITYMTGLRDDLFWPIPVGGDGLGNEGIGYLEVFCCAPHLYGMFGFNGGVELLDFGPTRSVGTFPLAPRDSGNDEQVYAGASRVVLVQSNGAWVWNRRSRRLVSHWNLKRAEGEEVGLMSTAYAPHAGVIMQAVGPQLRAWNVRTGKLAWVAPHALAEFDAEYGEAKEASHVVFSPNAHLCFYDTTNYDNRPGPRDDEDTPRDGPPGPTHVASCASGLTLWTIAPAYTLTFGGDGRTVWAQRAGALTVEMCDAQTGKVLRTVPIGAGCRVLGSSSDGAALYSHDKAGRVYRQGL